MLPGWGGGRRTPSENYSILSLPIEDLQISVLILCLLQTLNASQSKVTRKILFLFLFKCYLSDYSARNLALKVI